MTKVDEPLYQAAALPFRDRKICLVSTSSGKGLIIPKGHVPEGTHPALLAVREAWEEAGLIGRIERRPFGKYTFMKAGQEHTVQVYLLAVTEWARSWPEQGVRRRLWCSVEGVSCESVITNCDPCLSNLQNHMQANVPRNFYASLLDLQ